MKTAKIEYSRLRQGALELAQAVLSVQPKHISNPQISYIVHEAFNLSQAIYSDCLTQKNNFYFQNEKFSTTVESIMHHLTTTLPHYISGQWSIKKVINHLSIEFPNFWENLMIDSPMGDYAILCEKILLQEKLLHGKVLELGAGVGNLSKLIYRYPDKYIRTDKNSRFLTYANLLGPNSKIIEKAYDFDQQGEWRNLNTIVAVNALHCARDKVATLSFLNEMLMPGGYLVFAEGQNPVLQANKEPWALNMLFGLFDGWWDQGGFLSREKWRTYLLESKYSEIKEFKMTEDGYDFGGVILARKQY